MNREDRRAHAARLCDCGSGKKFRNCCEPIVQAEADRVRQQVDGLLAMSSFSTDLVNRPMACICVAQSTSEFVHQINCPARETP